VDSCSVVVAAVDDWGRRRLPVGLLDNVRGLLGNTVGRGHQASRDLEGMIEASTTRTLLAVDEEVGVDDTTLVARKHRACAERVELGAGLGGSVGGQSLAGEADRAARLARDLLGKRTSLGEVTTHSEPAVRIWASGPTEKYEGSMVGAVKASFELMKMVPREKGCWMPI
jgi:hypothetical protein